MSEYGRIPAEVQHTVVQAWAAFVSATVSLCCSCKVEKLAVGLLEDDSTRASTKCRVDLSGCCSQPGLCLPPSAGGKSQQLLEF